MADPKQAKRGLGRGLSALMADVGVSETTDAAAPRRAEQNIAIESIRANPNQPRRTFEPEPLEELAESIREKGIIQPLILRRDPEDASLYQIVAGERRWRAAQMAQLHEVPALVRDLNDVEVLEVAIIENIQRSDLNPIDEAAGYRQLMDSFGHTQEQMSKALGKSRSHIANLLRLLNLPQYVRNLLAEGKLSAGHARALVATEDPAAIADQIVARGLSVRQTEELVKSPKAQAAPKAPKPAKDADTRALEADLSVCLGAMLTIDHDHKSGGGKVVIAYRNVEQLDDLCRTLSSAARMEWDPLSGGE